MSILDLLDFDSFISKTAFYMPIFVFGYSIYSRGMNAINITWLIISIIFSVLWFISKHEAYPVRKEAREKPYELVKKWGKKRATLVFFPIMIQCFLVMISFIYSLKQLIIFKDDVWWLILMITTAIPTILFIYAILRFTYHLKKINLAILKELKKIKKQKS